jgi:beta-lactamase class A
MTSSWSRIATGAVIVASVAFASSAMVPNDRRSVAQSRPAAVPERSAVSVPVRSAPAFAPAPAFLRDQIRSIVRDFNGTSGIAVISLKDRWSADWNGDRLFPQQSCSKLWVALTALDAVDRGRLRLSQQVTLTRDDLTLFHQPLAAKVLKGGHTTTLDALLFQAITGSDNTANDRLMRAAGGPNAVRDMLARKKLNGIRFYEGERALQSKVAGLTWKQSYSLNGEFYRARSDLPAGVRKAAFDRYVADPYDGAAPMGIATALARLQSGELLSAASTHKILSTMAKTKTGGMRVRAALAPGWTWNHKTGTGQTLNGRSAGINDIGLLTAPDGSVYAMAIMTNPNSTDGGAQEMMRAITKAVIAQHQRSRSGA